MEKAPENGRPNPLRDWLAWKRRSRVNKTMFVVSLAVAAFVTAAFAWAIAFPAPGDFARYLTFYWIWGLCAVGIMTGLVEYRTRPVRRGGNSWGELFILFYLGALLIATRAINLFLFHG
ncbi:hypothetical protein [Rubrobacter calidifluminis]|uniref:hypothetical protein n=1 Tax=Rubrobacter calidifluminis TaxID=1392640 RepID=UPI0023602309|nr:hypothetical protein [Rubrobacter calidifluminis]